MPVVPPAVLGVPPAPPGTGARTEIVAYIPGEVSCASERVAPVRLVRPWASVSTRYGPDPGAASLTTYRLTFAIDAQGRPRTIRRDAAALSFPYGDISDLPPAARRRRIARRRARADCSIRYGASVMPLAAAAMHDVYELASRPETVGYAAALRDRVRPAGSTCPGEPGQYRRLNMPAFETLPDPADGWAWVFLAFDVDGAGRPGDARILGTSGDAALERAGLRALLGNRYAPGRGYRGCTYHFFHTGSIDRPAPDLPADTPGDDGDRPGCVVDPRSIPGLLDGSAYPVAFSRRRIEGVAVVRYPPAPGGAVGNVKVLVSEPDEAFGIVARNAFSNARVAESDAGRRGCVQHVRFRLPPDPKRR